MPTEKSCPKYGDESAERVKTGTHVPPFLRADGALKTVDTVLDGFPAQLPAVRLPRIRFTHQFRVINFLPPKVDG